RQLRMRGFKTGHVVRRIAGPALAADVLIEPAIAVGDDVEAGNFLLGQVYRKRIDVLFAESRGDHGIEEGPDSQILRIPTRTGQGSDHGRRQYLPRCRFKHSEFSLILKKRY